MGGEGKFPRGEDKTLLNQLNLLARSARLEAIKRKIPKSREWWTPAIGESDEDWLKPRIDSIIDTLATSARMGEFITAVGGTMDEDWEDLVCPDSGEEWSGPTFQGRAKLLADELRRRGVRAYGFRDKELRAVVFIVEWTGFQSS